VTSDQDFFVLGQAQVSARRSFSRNSKTQPEELQCAFSLLEWPAFAMLSLSG